MITGATVAGFKRFRRQRFELAPLTVLTGLNGSGKTSLLQAILLAAETSTTVSPTLSLNGPLGLELGTAEDVLNRDSASPVEISLEGADLTVATWRLAAPSEKALYLDVADWPDTVPRCLSGAPRGFSYFSAERFGHGDLRKSPAPRGRAGGGHPQRVLRAR